MKQLPQWMTELQARKDGESAGDHIARIVRAMVGVSFDRDRQRLEELFLANEPTMAEAKATALRETNCATTMRAIYALAGCDHPLVTCPYPPNSHAVMSWIFIAVREKRALFAAQSWRSAGAGWGLHYATPGKNDDHVEWLLEKPSEDGTARHAGGGKQRNAILAGGPDNIRWSLGRPLVYVIDPEMMLAKSNGVPRTTCEVQAALNRLGFGPLVVDGAAGPKTKTAVAAFQQASGIAADGVLTDVTRAALARALLALDAKGKALRG